MTEAPPTVGVVVALPAEAAPLRRIGKPDKRPGLRIRVCGMGPERARAAAADLVRAGVGALVSWGTCGGLQNPAITGSLILATSVVDEHGTLEVDPTWRAAVGNLLEGLVDFHGGVLGSCDEVVTASGRKAALAARGWLGVDMESAAIAATAMAAGLPFLALRAVADGPQQELPAAVYRSVDPFGRPRRAILLRELLGSPGSLPGLIRLGLAFQRALRSLDRTARLLGPGMGRP